MSLSYRNRLILAKTETTVGTAIALAKADAVLCGEVKVTPLAAEEAETAGGQGRIRRPAETAEATSTRASSSPSSSPAPAPRRRRRPGAGCSRPAT